jgi:hypothetical protein
MVKKRKRHVREMEKQYFERNGKEMLTAFLRTLSISRIWIYIMDLPDRARYQIVPGIRSSRYHIYGFPIGFLDQGD